MDKLEIFKTKLMNFIIQISILTSFIFLFNYRFNIIFDSGITEERKFIIQLVANYVMFNANDYKSVYFITISWTLISLIPIFIFVDYKKAYSTNLTTFFFPNFFFYVFLYRYSPNFFDFHFQTLILQTIILGLFIVILSFGLTFILKILTKPKAEKILEDLKQVSQKIKTVCPHCGTQFESIPQYCYNCSKELIIEESNNN